MSKQYFLDLTPAGVILYPCFIDGCGFDKNYPGMVMFLLELDIEKNILSKLGNISYHVLYQEPTDNNLLTSAPFINKKEVCSYGAKDLIFYSKKRQRLSIIKPYLVPEEQREQACSTGIFAEDKKPWMDTDDVYAHITSRQLLELIGFGIESTCPVIDAKQLTRSFFASMNQQVHDFYVKNITESSRVIGVPNKDDSCTIESCFGRYILHKDAKLTHESVVQDEDMSDLYYHHEAPKINADSEYFKKDIFNIVLRTVSHILKRDYAQMMIKDMLNITKPISKCQIKPLSGGHSFDVSDYLIHYFEQKNAQKARSGVWGIPNHPPIFYKTVSQLLYICISSSFFSKYQYRTQAFTKRISISQIQSMHKMAVVETQPIISLIKDGLPGLFINTDNDPLLPEYYESSSNQVTISLPIAILMVGLLQSTTQFSYILGTEANPMLILTAGLTAKSAECIFSLSNRNNRSSAALIELANAYQVTILSRQAGTAVSFGDDVVIDDSVYVSSLDLKQNAKEEVLEFYHRNGASRDHLPLYIKDLSLYEATQAIVSYKSGLKQVKAGVFITPYREIDINSDLNRVLLWLSFYYKDVRLLKIAGNLLGSHGHVHLVAFFHPHDVCNSSAEITHRFEAIRSFGNVQSVHTIDGIAQWVGYESIYMLTKDIFRKENNEQAVLSTKQIINLPPVESHQDTETQEESSRGEQEINITPNNLDEIDELDDLEDLDDLDDLDSFDDVSRNQNKQDDVDVILNFAG